MERHRNSLRCPVADGLPPTRSRSHLPIGGTSYTSPHSILWFYDIFIVGKLVSKLSDGRGATAEISPAQCAGSAARNPVRPEGTVEKPSTSCPFQRPFRTNRRGRVTRVPIPYCGASTFTVGKLVSKLPDGRGATAEISPAHSAGSVARKPIRPEGTAEKPSTSCRFQRPFRARFDWVSQPGTACRAKISQIAPRPSFFYPLQTLRKPYCYASIPFHATALTQATSSPRHPTNKSK
jgi:hypothetical protein